jgi:pyrroline-5-carboxylate reductase
MEIGFIGFGNMGSAIAELIKQDYSVLCFDKDNSRTQGHSGIEIAASSKDLTKKAEVIILAIKPQDFSVVLDEIKDCLNNKLVISIAAGVATRYIEEKLGQARVIRTMPNILVKIGRGLTCLTKGKFVTEKDMELADKLFAHIGKTFHLQENMMNAEIGRASCRERV